MRALLLGGTGAMGGYLQRELVDVGWDVAVTSRSAHEPIPGITFLQGNAQDLPFLSETLKGDFDVVIDFMTWRPEVFSDVARLVLESSGRYVFLSSYRVFADSPVIVEGSPRLLEACLDERYRAGNEYAIAKAREEDILRAAPMGNWTIVRPAITFSGGGSGRFQLCTYESGLWLWRALRGLPVPVVPEMMAKQCTLTWAGDVARMIARLASSPDAAGEDYNVATSQHQAWGDVLELYRSVLPIKTRDVTLEEYESHCGPALKELGYIPQVRYDRMLNRVLDNSKVLACTGLAQSDLSDVREILVHEFRRFLERSPRVVTTPTVQGRLDRAAGSSLPLGSAFKEFGASGAMKYLVGKLGLV